MNLPPWTDTFPPCSLNCLSSNLASAPTVVQNLKLLCANVTLEKAIAKCVRGACNFADQQLVNGQNAAICKGQRVPNQAPFATVVLGFLGTVTQVVIGLRIYSRMKLATRLGIGIDDYLIVAASVIIGYVMISGTYDVLVLGMGVHTFNVEPSKRFPNDVLYWLDEIAYQIAMALVKSSILCFYLRIFPDQRFRYACYTMLGVVAATGLTFTFVTVFQCTPFRGVFDKSIVSKCIDNNTATFASSGVSIAIDFTILLMPIRELLTLRVSRTKRNSVLFMFSFGLLASIVSVVRLPFIIPFGKTADPLYDNIGPGIWTFAEMATAVIASCLPALKPFVVKLFPRFFAEPPSDGSPGVFVFSPPDMSPRGRQDVGTVSRVLNSLFSRRDHGHESGRSKYFDLQDGKIVQLNTRFSAISLGISDPESWKEKFADERGPWAHHHELAPQRPPPIR